MLNLGDRIRLKGAAVAVEEGFFDWAEKMLGGLEPAASVGSAAMALRQRMDDIQIAFWRNQYRFASAVTARFPNYLPGRLYADLSRSHNENGLPT